MSLGLNKTKRRIASVRSTQKITKAMGMIASVKLKRCKERFEASKQYRDQIEELASKCFYYAKNKSLPLCSVKENAEGTLYIVITSDLGLCAGYNSNLLKYAHSIINPEKDALILVGEKGKHHFSRDPSFAERILKLKNIGLGASMKEAGLFAYQIEQIYKENNFKAVQFIYTHYINSLRFEPRFAAFLPISPNAQIPHYEEYAPPIFEPTPEETLEELLPHYLAAMFYNILAESELSEQSSRRMAMDNANDNADELLEKLTIEYNKARQTAITQEIVEVVSGSNHG